MADLSLDASHEYWSNYPDPIIYRVIAFMEGVETWTFDEHPEAEEALLQLSAQMEKIKEVELSQLKHEDVIIELGGYLKTSRVLRLLQAFDMAHPGSASRILVHAEKTTQSSDDPAGLFLRRNVIFERLRLLSRVFSPERCALVTKALAGSNA